MHFREKDPKETVAYKISVQAVPELAGQDTAGTCHAHDKRSTKILEENYDRMRRTGWLKPIWTREKMWCFLTLGDPTVYSTYMYVHQRLEAKGYPSGDRQRHHLFLRGGSPD